MLFLLGVMGGLIYGLVYGLIHAVTNYWIRIVVIVATGTWKRCRAIVDELPSRTA